MSKEEGARQRWVIVLQHNGIGVFMMGLETILSREEIQDEIEQTCKRIEELDHQKVIDTVNRSRFE